MVKTMITIYVILWFYTAYAFLTLSMNTDVIMSVLLLDIDFLVIAVFNMMGLFPLAFLMHFLMHVKPWNTGLKLLTALGFMTGAFALYPAVLLSYNSESNEQYQRTTMNSLIGVVGLISSIVLLLSGVFFGSFSTYFTLYQEDLFIRIMTFDLIVLYILSTIVAKKYYKKWQISYLPLIGFYFLIIKKQ